MDSSKPPTVASGSEDGGGVRTLRFCRRLIVNGTTVTLDGNVNKLLTDLNADDIGLAKDGLHLKVTVLGTGHVITIDEQFFSDVDYWGIEKIQFANGSFMASVPIRNMHHVWRINDEHGRRVGIVDRRVRQ